MEVTTSPTQSYVIVFEDDNHETEFEAIGDSQAIGLSQKQYAGQKWKLFRLTADRRVNICDQSPECLQNGEEKKENVH